jgi:hypothetical protein
MLQYRLMYMTYTAYKMYIYLVSCKITYTSNIHFITESEHNQFIAKQLIL